MRTINALSEGLPDAAFESLDDPDGRIFQMGGNGRTVGWPSIEGRRRAFLVSQHLERVETPTEDINAICPEARAYTGLVGPYAYTRLTFNSAAVRITQVSPYKLLVCDINSDLKFTLLPTPLTHFGKTLESPDTP